jgi:hypothetical protein
METLGVEVKVNGEKLCRAGIESDDYTMTCILTTILYKGETQPEIFIYVTALDSEKEEYVRWVNKTLSSEDTISLEVITEQFDVPSDKETVEDSKQLILENQIRHYYKLKEELKGYVE